MTDIADDAAERPFISVVIPVYNDPKGLAQTLDSLADQSYPNERHEVVIVDNGSTDDTPAVAHEYCSRHDQFTFVVESTVQGSYAARNRGVRNATGSIIAFVDADMTVPGNWLDRVAPAMADVEYLACGVQVSADGPETLAAKYDRLSGLRVDRYIDNLNFAPTCCLVVKASLFDEVGLFDSRLISSGDLEFGNRVHDSGRTLEHRSGIRMFHPARDSVRSILRKAARIGRGRQQLRRFYPDRYGSPARGLINPGSFLPPLPWRVGDRLRDWETLSLREKLSFYLIAILTGFARTYGKFREALAARTWGGLGPDPVQLDEHESAD